MYSLIMVIVANTVMMFVIKFSEEKNTNRNYVTLVNYIIGSIVAVVLSKDIWGHIYLDKSLFFTVFLGIFNAVLMTACMVLQQKSIGKNGAGISTTYNRLGILIPTILSIFILTEYPNVINIVGIAFAVFAIIYSYNKENEPNMKKIYKLLFAILLMDGIIDFNSKLFSVFCSTEYKGLYAFISFFISSFIMFIVVMKERKHIKKKDIYYGIGVGIPNVLITFGMVSAAAVLPAYLVFPVYGGSVILLVNLLEVAIFKIRLSKREWMATMLIAIALVMLNL